MLLMKPKIGNHKSAVMMIMFSIVIALIVGFFIVVSTQSPLPISGSVQELENSTVSEINFAWPSRGQAIIGTLDGGVKEIFGDNQPRPTASLAKVITALVVLDKKPLTGDGPLITMTDEDVALYTQTVANNGSYLYIKTGEQFTERQIIEAMMLPSANNMADTLVRWAFGNQDGYRTAASKWLSENDLLDTTIGSDGSGLDPSTTSSLSDLFKIASLAINNPVLNEIMQEKSAEFPGIGEVMNTNSLLRDDNGYVGIKTGHTEAAGACLMFAAQRSVGDVNITIIGVLTGQDFGTTFNTARALTDSAMNNLIEYKIPAGIIIGQYDIPWGATVSAITNKDIVGVTWKDEGPMVDIKLDEVKVPAYDSPIVGDIIFGDQSADIKLDGLIPSPGFIWKIKNLPSLQW
jgi:D-alanyl-D-alanine carboxypeptidase (penicillin-binding protein 5/6)